MNGDICKLFKFSVAIIVIRYAVRFISQRPHNNRGVILIPFIHSAYSVPEMHFPFGIMRNRSAKFRYSCNTVTFNIRLVNYINSVFVAKVEEYRVRRVVRGSHTIHIILLEKLNILFRILDRHIISGFRIGIVVVDT